MRRFLAAVFALAATAAHAEVTDVQPSGFQVRHVATVRASPDKAYIAITRVGEWWSSDHSWSGDAANLSLEARAGGCWCEALPGGGSVQHMRVIFAQPGKALRLTGALGPLAMTGAGGNMSFTLTPRGEMTEIVWTYDVGGYSKDGFANWSKAVDGVLGAQMARLTALAEKP
ncbi:MAG TPA: SRPBCC family protein [Caulobacteraceae bacterium]